MRFSLSVICCLAFACVDETGYECGDGSGQIFVDETGYLKVDLVAYTAPGPIDGPQPVSLFGRPGALCTGGGSLVIDDRPPIDIAPDGAFRVDVEGALGDTFSFDYTPPDGDQAATAFTLEDSLDVDTPELLGSGPPLLSPPDDGVVTVNFASLSSGQVPSAAFNDTEGDPAVFSDDGAPVEVAGEIGDTVCVFVLDGGQSPFVCADVPEL